ncbi:hypothetical protein [Nocardioides sp. TF02-7]|uniref:hypothetical protein n=1 Tax=Nocardioides sp. TF02-7 TaxID=2917724 RepID=UPI001F050B87|nr:hypothetical protein [Nocardioides sp. TF02-7]UMG93462.1 hypothetical protein MF408_04350 [Nocardioides sp. TF02-7]
MLAAGRTRTRTSAPRPAFETRTVACRRTEIRTGAEVDPYHRSLAYDVPPG